MYTIFSYSINELVKHPLRKKKGILLVDMSFYIQLLLTSVRDFGFFYDSKQEENRIQVLFLFNENKIVISGISNVYC